MDKYASTYFFEVYLIDLELKGGIVRGADVNTVSTGRYILKRGLVSLRDVIAVSWYKIYIFFVVVHKFPHPYIRPISEEYSVYLKGQVVTIVFTIHYIEVYWMNPADLHFKIIRIAFDGKRCSLV